MNRKIRIVCGLSLVLCAVSSFFLAHRGSAAPASHPVWPELPIAADGNRMTMTYAELHRLEVRSPGDYGPWQSSDMDRDRLKHRTFRPVARIDRDGHLQFSLRRLGVIDGFWPQETSPLVKGSRVMADGRISFVDGHDRTFVVNPHQVIFFDEDPATVFMFEPNGLLMSITTSMFPTITAEYRP